MNDWGGMNHMNERTREIKNQLNLNILELVFVFQWNIVPILWVYIPICSIDNISNGMKIECYLCYVVSSIPSYFRIFCVCAVSHFRRIEYIPA